MRPAGSVALCIYAPQDSWGASSPDSGDLTVPLNMPGISLAAAVGFGLRKFGTIVVHGYCVRLASRHGKGIDAVKMIPSSSIPTDIVAIHIDRIASHKFGYDDYLRIAAWLWCGRIGRGRIVARIIWRIIRFVRWIVRLFIDIDIDVIAPAIAIVLKSMPTWSIAIEPHLLPARILNISRIICH